MRSQRLVAPRLNEAARSARHTHAMETGPVVWPPHRALAKSKRDCTRKRDRAMPTALAITTATASRAGARPGVAASSREPARPRSTVQQPPLFIRQPRGHGEPLSAGGCVSVPDALGPLWNRLYDGKRERARLRSPGATDLVTGFDESLQGVLD